jgi:hypothetical protein
MRDYMLRPVPVALIGGAVAFFVGYLLAWWAA